MTEPRRTVSAASAGERWERRGFREAVHENIRKTTGIKEGSSLLEVLATGNVLERIRYRYVPWADPGTFVNNGSVDGVESLSSLLGMNEQYTELPIANIEGN